MAEVFNDAFPTQPPITINDPPIIPGPPPLTAPPVAVGTLPQPASEGSTHTLTTPSQPPTLTTPGAPVEGESAQEPSSSSSNQPKIPVLRLKKKGNDEMSIENATFEKQDVSKNDSYCWVCHEGGEVLCCDRCPRVFHIQCSGLATPPSEDDDWVCPVCKNVQRKPKRSRPNGLKDLLLMAVTRMSFQGTELFQQDVHEEIASHYREYIFHPMHLGMIKRKAAANGFQSTREFLHDTEWILHNCIIYNGAKHALTKIAKSIVKICKEDMREVELCPSCYSLTVKQPADWFCIPCNPPHRVVLAKVRGYPLWPAKLISETSDKCDVRFFGQHDRSLVQKASIQELNGPPPTPSAKTVQWTQSMEELCKYRQNINQMLQQMSDGKAPEQFIAEKILEAPKMPTRENTLKLPRIPKKSPVPVPPRLTPATDHTPPPPPVVNNHSTPQAHVSNHIPFIPQIVEVNPPLSESEETGSIHGNSVHFMEGEDSEPSSPGSDSGLRIDLAGSELDTKERGRVRMAPPANKSMLRNGPKKPNRVSLPPCEPYYDSSYSLIGGSETITPTAFRSYRRPPGETLSALATSLAERRAAELSREQGDVYSFGQEEFSTMYPPDKTAIAVVDPNEKRTPRRVTSKLKRRGGGADTSPGKKSRRLAADKNNDLTGNDMDTSPSTNGLIAGLPASALMGSSSDAYRQDDDTQLELGEGLMADTVRCVERSFQTRLDSMASSGSDDLGYKYFSDKLMSSLKSVVYEMLSMFEAKGKMGAKQIKEHLHSAWPVPDSRLALEKMRRELKQEMTQSLKVVTASAELERDQIVSEVKKQAEIDKDLAVQETKKKKWCSYCWKEAQYNCCWNANYCNEVCQQSHWPEHMAVCTQVQQPASSGFVPRTPASILSPTAAGNSSSVFMFNTPSQHDDQSRGGSSRQRIAAADILDPMSVQATVTPVAEPMANYELTSTMTTIEQIPNSNILFNHSPSSPQAHYRSAIMDKNLSLHTLPPSSPHSNTSSLASIPLHPVSPASSPAGHHDNVHAATQGFSWPYQQPIGAIPDFPQTLPYLPQVPAATPTSQHNSFFRVF